MRASAYYNHDGGYVNGYALDVFTRRNYLMMTPRGRFAVPSRQALGQRALGLPTVLVVNESSLSDAEDFTQGYRTLGLGKVVRRPVFDECDRVRPAEMVYLSLSFDHRVVDGAVAAAFTNAVIRHLANPALLLLPPKL